MHSEIAASSDAAAIAALMNAAYRGAGSRFGWTHEAGLVAGSRTTAKDVAATIADIETTVLVRRSDEPPALLGCVAVQTDGADRCTISMLAVAPESQTAGLGHALLADAEQFAARKGARIAKLTVVQQRESLIAWYERRGYGRTGALEAFPHDGRVGAPLRDDLVFVVLEKAI